MNWRVYTLISFAFQSIRIPGAIYFSGDLSELSLYFVMISISIPAQFLANDVIQYRYFSIIPRNLTEKAALAAILVSIIYIWLLESLSIACVFTVYNIALIIVALTFRSFRDRHSAQKVIRLECVFNVLQTIIIALVAIYAPNSKKSLLIILWLSLFAFAFSLTVWFIVRNRRLLFKQLEVTQSTAGDCLKFQIALMINTQLERMVIGAYLPALLSVISIAASLTLAWRKLVLDDAILFQMLRHNTSGTDDVIGHAVNRYYRFSKPINVALILVSMEVFLIQYSGVSAIITANNWALFVASVVLLSGLYLASLPTGIVATNLLRLAAISPTRRSWYYILLTCSAFIGFMMLGKSLQHYREIVVVLGIYISATINVVLFVDLTNVRANRKLIVILEPLVFMLILGCFLFEALNHGIS